MENKTTEIKKDFALSLADKAYLFVKDIDKAQKIAVGILSVREASSKLQECSEKSIVQCMRDALALGLTVDKNQYCWLVPYKQNATLQIGYKGYIHKIKNSFPDATFNVGIIYKDDEFVVSENETEGSKYTLNRANPFAKNEMQGAYCYIRIGGRGYLELMNKDELDMCKSKNQTVQNNKKYSNNDVSVWDEWASEMAKKAVIKRACKVHFAQEISELEEYDNKQYNLEPKTAGLETINNGDNK